MAASVPLIVICCQQIDTSTQSLRAGIKQAGGSMVCGMLCGDTGGDSRGAIDVAAGQVVYHSSVFNTHGLLTSQVAPVCHGACANRLLGSCVHTKCCVLQCSGAQ